jgi:hypothetical protein
MATAKALILANIKSQMSGSNKIKNSLKSNFRDSFGSSVIEVSLVLERATFLWLSFKPQLATGKNPLVFKATVTAMAPSDIKGGLLC